MATQEIERCSDCPFLEKQDWSNEDDSGTEYTGCVLGGMPAPFYKHKYDLYGREPPPWCKLREGAVLVTLKVRNA